MIRTASITGLILGLDQTTRTTAISPRMWIALGLRCAILGVGGDADDTSALASSSLVRVTWLLVHMDGLIKVTLANHVLFSHGELGASALESPAPRPAQLACADLTRWLLQGGVRAQGPSLCCYISSWKAPTVSVSVTVTVTVSYSPAALSPSLPSLLWLGCGRACCGLADGPREGPPSHGQKQGSRGLHLPDAAGPVSTERGLRSWSVLQALWRTCE